MIGRITRKSIGAQLDEEFARRGIVPQYVTEQGRSLYLIAGELYDAGRAADTFLPAGFDGHFGAEIELTCGHWFTWAKDALAHKHDEEDICANDPQGQHSVGCGCVS